MRTIEKIASKGAARIARALVSKGAYKGESVGKLYSKFIHRQAAGPRGLKKGVESVSGAVRSAGRSPKGAEKLMAGLRKEIAAGRRTVKKV